MKLFSKFSPLISTIILILIVVILSMILLSYYQVDMNDNDGLRVLNRGATFGGSVKEGLFAFSKIFRKIREEAERREREAKRKREEAERREREKEERIRKDREAREAAAAREAAESPVIKELPDISKDENITIVKALEDKEDNELSIAKEIHDKGPHIIEKKQAEDYATSLLLHERAHEKHLMAKNKLLKHLQPALIE